MTHLKDILEKTLTGDPIATDEIVRLIYKHDTNYDIIVDFYKNSDKNDSYVQNIMGVIYDLRHTNLDYGTAFTFWKYSAEQGNLFGMTNLAASYFLGRGVEKNHEEAFRLAKLAADQKYAVAQNILGAMYYKVHKNYEEAYKCYKLRADQGNVLGIVTLANLYLKGEGVEMNVKQAYELYKQAIFKGDDWSKKKLEDVMFNHFKIDDLIKNEKTIKEYQIDNEQLKGEIQDLKDFINHIKYHPDGINYKKIEEDFYIKTKIDTQVPKIS